MAQEEEIPEELLKQFVQEHENMQTINEVEGQKFVNKMLMDDEMEKALRLWKQAAVDTLSEKNLRYLNTRLHYLRDKQ